jgi:uncharacterized protein (TIGR03084 family)
MPALLDELLADLEAESDDLDAVARGLGSEGWARATPAEGWDVARQIGHLTWTDERSLLALTDPGAFTRSVPPREEIPAMVEDGAAGLATLGPAELLAGWRRGRRLLISALRSVDPAASVPWYGPPMRPASMATSRLMETWALGVVRAPTARLRHVAHLGHRTLGHAFRTRGLEPPSAPVRVELVAPDGGSWTFGPEGAMDRVTGPAIDFCLLVVRRRHRDDLALTATPGAADAWLDVAQAFAGPPGPGRPPAP